MHGSATHAVRAGKNAQPRRPTRRATPTTNGVVLGMPILDRSDQKVRDTRRGHVPKRGTRIGANQNLLQAKEYKHSSGPQFPCGHTHNLQQTAKAREKGVIQCRHTWGHYLLHHLRCSSVKPRHTDRLGCRTICLFCNKCRRCALPQTPP